MHLHPLHLHPQHPYPQRGPRHTHTHTYTLTYFGIYRGKTDSTNCTLGARGQPPLRRQVGCLVKAEKGHKWRGSSAHCAPPDPSPETPRPRPMGPRLLLLSPLPPTRTRIPLRYVWVLSSPPPPMGWENLQTPSSQPWSHHGPS